MASVESLSALSDKELRDIGMRRKIVKPRKRGAEPVTVIERVEDSKERVAEVVEAAIPAPVENSDRKRLDDALDEAFRKYGKFPDPDLDALYLYYFNVQFPSAFVANVRYGETGLREKTDREWRSLTAKYDRYGFYREFRTLLRDLEERPASTGTSVSRALMKAKSRFSDDDIGKLLSERLAALFWELDAYFLAK